MSNDGFLFRYRGKWDFEFVENGLGKISYVCTLSYGLDHLCKIARLEKISVKERQRRWIFNARADRKTRKGNRLGRLRDDDGTTHKVRVAVGTNKQNVARFDQIIFREGVVQEHVIQCRQWGVKVLLEIPNPNDLYGMA